jgi:predicted nucleotidyltransferase
MTPEQVIATLKEREADLRALGVVYAALFGSVARGQQRPESDIDILVDLDPKIVHTIIDYVGVKEYIADLFDEPVDVVNQEGLKPVLRPRVDTDAIHAF